MRIPTRCLTLFSAILLTGCASTKITNLTPRQQTRNAAGAYPVEVEFRCNLTALKPETIRPYVQVGDDNYLMRKTPTVKDRWETLIPVPADKSILNYRVKVDFEYSGFPEQQVNSALSQPYQLQISE